jgi:hypothetical protein
MKKLKWIILGLVLLVFIVVGAVLLRIDSIVRSVVETQATDSLGLQTQLDSANVSLLGGTVKLNGLRVASPQGFSAPQMMSLDGIKVGASLGKLREDPIGVEQIVIDRPKLVIEQSGGKFNFQVLSEQQSKKPVDAGKPGDGTREASEPVRLIIHDLTVNNAQVVLRPGIPGLDKEYALSIPSFDLTDIGTGEGNKNGAAIKEVVTLMVTTLAQKAAESKDLPQDVRQLLSLNADAVKERIAGELNKRVGKLGKELEKNLGSDAGKQAQDAIQKGLGNLLGGDGGATTRGR